MDQAKISFFLIFNQTTTGDKLTLAQQLTFFTDAPDSYSELGKFEKEMQGRIEILVPPKDNYVFVDDRVVKQNNSK